MNPNGNLVVFIVFARYKLVYDYATGCFRSKRNVNTGDGGAYSILLRYESLMSFLVCMWNESEKLDCLARSWTMKPE